MNQPNPLPSSPTPPRPLLLRRSDQLFVGTMLCIAIGLLGLYWVRMNGWGQPPIEIDRLPARQYDYQLDVNGATWIEWSLLEGIGEKTAKRIIAYRDEHGPFQSVDDVRKIPGIGPKTWEQIRPWLMIGRGKKAE